MKTVTLELTVPEIVLIKECIFDALSKNQLARQKYSGRMPAYDIAAKGQQENLQTLSKNWPRTVTGCKGVLEHGRTSQ